MMVLAYIGEFGVAIGVGETLREDALIQQFEL
jgi:hypothetical protein